MSNIVNVDEQFRIAIFGGSERNVDRGENRLTTFKEMAEWCNECYTGEKNDGYFVRGYLDESNFRRRDENLRGARLIIIDGDSAVGVPVEQGSIEPRIMHEALKALGYAHFIYTTHSHRNEETGTGKQRKFRAVLLADREFSKPELKTTIECLMKELFELGCKVRWVREMSVYSQPWFIPRRTDPKDGKFEHYAQMKGKHVSVSAVGVQGVGSDKGGKGKDGWDDVWDGDPKGIEYRIEEIHSGKNYHENILAISIGQLKDGVNIGNTVGMLKGIMRGCKDELRGTARWQERYKDIDRVVKEGRAKLINSGELSSAVVDEEIAGVLSSVKDTGRMELLDNQENDANLSNLSGDAIFKSLKKEMEELAKEKKKKRKEEKRRLKTVGKGSTNGGGVDLEEIEHMPLLREDGKKLAMPLPWPPELLGDFAQNCYDMQRYQYPEMAVVSAVGLLAGICGRKFNINMLGLNMYFTVIADTGAGKDSINRFISKALQLSALDGEKGMSFIGPISHTGPKSLNLTLGKKRSHVSVFTEAGLLLNVKVGNQAGLSKSLLELYTKSGEGHFSGEEGFSVEDEGIKSLASPSLSIINEATPEALLKAFADFGYMESGHAGRQSIFRIKGDKPYENYFAKDDVGDVHKKILKKLVGMCFPLQELAGGSALEAKGEKVVQVIVESDSDIEGIVRERSNYYTDIQNRHRDVDRAVSVMATRSQVKALKFMAISAVYNSKIMVLESNRADCPRCVQVLDSAGKEVWCVKILKEDMEWGYAMVDYELASVNVFFEGSGIGNNTDASVLKVDDLEVFARDIVGRVMYEMLSGDKYSGNGNSCSKMEKKYGRVAYSALRQNLNRNKKLKMLADDVQRGGYQPKSGLDKVLGYMESAGYIRSIRIDDFKTLRSANAGAAGAGSIDSAGLGAGAGAGAGAGVGKGAGRNRTGYSGTYLVIQQDFKLLYAG